MFLYKQVPAERLSGLSGLNRFSLMGKPLLGLILINRIRASHGSCNHPDGLSRMGFRQERGNLNLS